MTISSSFVPLNSAYLSTIQHQAIKLEKADLLLKDNDICLSFGNYDPIVLSDEGLKAFCYYLKIPHTFAKKLLKHSKFHVLAYLRSQLADLIEEESLLMVHENYQTAIGFAEEKYLPFTGKQAIELDNAIMNFAENSHKLELSGCNISEGLVHYSFFKPEEQSVESDSHPLWKMGYVVSYSLTGQMAQPHAYMQAMRLVCTNLQYLADRSYRHDFPVVEKYQERIAAINGFLQDPPDLRWDVIREGMRRMQQVSASVREVDDTRKMLLSALKIDKEDEETQLAIHEKLQWERISNAYQLSTHKPSSEWKARATTPIKMFDLYNYYTQEVSHAPSERIDHKLRTELLIHAGKMIAKKPDLIDVPPTVNWDVQ